MSDNAFDPSSLPMPKSVDLRRAYESVLMWAQDDYRGAAIVKAEADREGRGAFLHTALLFLVCQSSGIKQRPDGQEAMRGLIAQLAAKEADEEDH